MTGETHAVVLGGGLTGMLTSAVLARHLDRVTVVERDVLPEGPELRKGVPQARHAHLLWSGGARAIDAVLPGTVKQLIAEGAHRLYLPRDIVWLTPHGWQNRFSGSQFMVTCSRALLDWVVRRQALADERITVLQETDVLGLTGSAERVRGVRLRDKDGQSTELTADLVVDAGGRASAMRRWLPELGLGEVEEDLVDSGIAYATRVFKAPAGVADKFPMVNVAAAPGLGKPGQNGALVPIEDGRWLVTLAGTRGGEPPTDDDSFLDFARGLRHPVLAELLERAEPLGPVKGSRSTVNRRLYYDRVADWPAGLLVLGDAFAAFNPVYGHGMSCSALSAKALDAELGRNGLTAATARTVLQKVAKVVDDPWLLATTQDICYPGTKVTAQDPRITPRGDQEQQFADLLGTAALHDPVVSAAAMQVTALAAPVGSLESPHLVAALRKGKKHVDLAGPPFTDAERAALDGAGTGTLTTA
ncbi:FAD-dependent monooxygenase [Streptomyces sp. NA04227]|uniref:FAD-dependent oxidoreductase n=1 Tax=Streptomyces sp. NA04227 TaxID=2742136 RepID=UPI001591C803|nr:FAD-dependent monooxygenase [Streptomyces sp. NA04227]QKW05103.1 FAD-dependent monooxygenase [Streptomyces sp. NA04227]